MSVLLFTVLPADAGAEGVSGYMEYSLAGTSAKGTDAAGVESRSHTRNMLQRYNLAIDKRVYPNLKVLTGGLFERSDSSGSVETGTAREDVDSTATKLRPFVDVDLSTSPFDAGVSYNRSEDRQKSLGAQAITLIRDQYAGMLGWNPDGFPSLRFQYLRTDNFDRGRKLRDSTSQTYQLSSQYRPARQLMLYYQGGRTDSEDRLSNVDTRDTIHGGRISYSDQVWNRRMSLGSDYTVTYRETEVRAGGAGEVGVSVLPQSGLSAIDDTPEQGALSANPALIDGNVEAVSGINIGFPGIGGNTERRNVGLDFGVPREVNTLFVRIDRELSAPVADSFSWEVYTSPDNLNWTPHQTVVPAIMDPFTPRFEIRFADLASRYVKVAVRPLAATVPLAADYPLIRVTELEAAMRTPAAEARQRTVSALNLFNFSARTRILSDPDLAHELTYTYAKATGSPSRYTLSNGLSAGHRFSKSVTALARIAREDGEDEGRKRTAYLFSGSLQAVPLPTLRHSLLATGRTETVEGKTNTTLSLFLYNTAALYKGIDANLAVGGSRAENEAGQKTDTVQADAGAVIVPNRKVTMNLTYSDKRDKISGGETPAERTQTNRSLQADVAVYPTATIYLFGSFRVEEPPGLGRRNVNNYSASWTPFPDGTLHLNFLYSETFRSETGGRDRTISPSLRLDFGRGSFFSLVYQNTSNRDDLQTSRSDIVSGNLRISF